MNKRIIELIAGTALYGLSSSLAFAIPFNEIGDAGQLPGTAQTVANGTTSILGSIGTPGDIDLFQFGWGGGILTMNTFNSPQVRDPQLFLFDGVGNGIGENDDAEGTLQSEISLNLAAGSYFLGISFFNDDALNVLGNDIFGIFPNFRDLNNNLIQGPNGSGGPLLTSWRTAASGTGSYNISFSSAVQGVPEPATLALMGLGLAGLGFARKRKAA